MDALFVSTYRAGVLNVIDDKSTIVDNLAQRCDVVNLLLAVPVELGNQHTEDWPPALASSIQ
jgi:hypothetical protein